MTNNNIIKSIIKSTCPHCKKEILIESLVSPAYVGEVFTEEKMNEAKQDCIARIDALSIDENQKEEVIKWVNNPLTIFAPGEVEQIVLSLLKSEEKEEKEEE
ncbi:MAG TPA: hypothetical protein ENH99_01535 [Candidatus Pacearchaeota archaeon]|nr:hypothetical protein [Candidatus Pacearchaeota archaeon]